MTAGLVADFYKEPQLVMVIRWLSVNFLFKALNSVQVAILSRKLAFKSLAIRSLIAMLIGSAVGMTMALLGYGVWSLVGQQLGIGLVEVIVLWSVSDWRPGLNISAKHLRELFSFGINIVGLNALTFLNSHSDNLLIGYYLGDVALGYYTIAYRLLTVMTELLTKTINQVALPTFSRLQQEPERLRSAFYKATQLTSLIAFPAFIGVSVLAPDLVPVVFGSQWTPSIPVMQILSFIGILQAVSYFNSSVILAMGKPSWNLAINSLSTVVNVVGFVIVVRWGIVAVAATFVIRAYLLSPLSLWAVNKLLRLNLSTYLRQYAAPLGGSFVMAIALLLTREFLSDSMSQPMLLVTYTVIGAGVYALEIWLMAPTLVQLALSLFDSVLSGGKFKKSESVGEKRK
jgi:PST family polysaccharide transporter